MKEREVLTSCPETNRDPANIVLSFGSRMSYGIFDFGYMIVYYWINAFMNIYLTGVVGLSLVTVATITIVVRIFDAINDPMIGALADRSRAKGGKFAPWLRWGGVALAVTITAMFSTNLSWSLGMKTAWIWITYLLLTVASTCCYMPYTALNGVMTSNVMERTKASSLRNILCTIGGQVVGLVAITMITWFSGASSGPESAKGYSFSVAICSVIFIICAFITARNCKEVVKPVVNKESTPLKVQLGALLRNKYAWILFVLYLVMGISQYGRSAILAYYAQFVAKDMGMIADFAICVFVATIVGNYFGVWLHKITKDKKRAIIIAYLIHAVSSAPMYYVLPSSVIYWIFMFISCATVCAVAGVGYSMVGDVTDYGEYKFGVRIDGIVSSVASMLMKAGGALSPAIILIVLDNNGFISGAVEQSGAAQNVLNWGMSWLLTASAVATIIAFLFYHLNDEKLGEYRRETQNLTDDNG